MLFIYRTTSMDMAKIFGSAEAVSSSAKPSPAPAAPAAAGDGKKAWHFIRQVTSVTRVSHECHTSVTRDAGG